jgi:hypothetical protein
MADHALLTPGAFVTCPSRPDWGLGQIQSIVGDLATANFENVGKISIRLNHVALRPAEPYPISIAGGTKES